MSTSLHSLRLLDVPYRYACGVFGRMPYNYGPLHHLGRYAYTNPCEKCGLFQAGRYPVKKRSRTGFDGISSW
jgi:hypothetical protein